VNANNAYKKREELMSLNRRNPRRDANEPAIVSALEAVGTRVWRVSGKGLPDLLCLRRGRWIPLGVKVPGGQLTDIEKAGVPWPLVESTAEALEAVGVTSTRMPKKPLRGQQEAS
jgi:hypothetical protein